LTPFSIEKLQKPFGLISIWYEFDSENYSIWYKSASALRQSFKKIGHEEIGLFSKGYCPLWRQKYWTILFDIPFCEILVFYRHNSGFSWSPLCPDQIESNRIK
jgi:hypothetical protein